MQAANDPVHADILARTELSLCIGAVIRWMAGAVDPRSRWPWK